jgi:hypothetical protein
MGNDPVIVGVPESTPLELRVNPCGNIPVSLQFNGGTPPNAVNAKV